MKILNLKLLFISLVFIITESSAATIDTVLTYSAAMHKNIKAVVITPQDYSAAKKFPVVYLLHGYSGSYKDWVTNDSDKTSIADLSDRYEVIVICPDGNYSSWYVDSPVDAAWKYETYISKELVNYIDTHYATIADRSGRAITGLSMGGYGALYLAFRHQDVYSACGSMSGGVDLTAFPDEWDKDKRFGSYKQNPKRWAAYSIANMTGLLKPNALAITFDCGTEDIYYVQIESGFTPEIISGKNTA